MKRQPAPGSLIFSDEFLAKARANRRAPEPLAFRWALMPGLLGERIRAQLEAAAALVPALQWERLMGHLRSADADQVSGAVSTLLLAKTLADHGWNVEHEPEFAGGTPDLRISKAGIEFIVEVKQILGSARSSNQPAVDRLQRSLARIRTQTPLHFLGVHISPSAKLRGFLAFVRRTLQAQPKGRIVFRDDGVLLSFELMSPLGEEVGAFGSYVGEGMWIGDHDTVRAAIDEKLKRYSCPLIVALDMVDCIHPFNTVEEVLLGQEQIVIPINPSTGGPAGEAHTGRALDGVVLRGNRDGERVRERLVALLPFELRQSDEGFRVSARLLANPASDHAAGLDAFLPVPCLVVSERRADSVTLRYLGEESLEPADLRWSHVP